MILKGKRGLIMGVANDKSIAWGIAKACAAQGAELGFTYQGEVFKKRVEPLVQSLGGASILVECDATNEERLDHTFAEVAEKWGHFDFLVHAIAFSNKEELKGRYCDTSLENFMATMHISCFSFTSIARRAAKLMPNGGAMLTLTYIGAERVIPNYNVMGVAKAALESSVRYLAADFGKQDIRVHALSAGPMRTLAGSAIANARYTFRTAEDTAALNRSVTLEDLGNSAVYLLSDMSRGTSGEVHYIDAGFRAMGMLPPGRIGAETQD
ncbi:MAG: Enoyl-[acyl-carrier-protein] reductase [Alphaproteobacteria bacterium]|nr:Enoyl-[acyl-carrier-protein] reductase [Alphaproteobacteria bacterium]